MEHTQIFSLLTDLMQSLFTVIPKFIGAFLVLIIGWIIAKTVCRVVQKVLQQSPLELMNEKLKSIDLFQKVDFEISISVFVAKIVYYFIFLVFIVAATDILGIEALSQLISDTIHYIPRLICAIFMMLIGALLADFVKGIIKTACDSMGIPNSGMLSTLGFYFIFIIMLVTALGQAGVDTTFINSNVLLVIGGVVFAFAFGYGLASRHFVANMLASMYLKKRLKVGDMIKVQNISGTIVEMDSATVILDCQGAKVMMPINTLVTDVVEITHSKSNQ